MAEVTWTQKALRQFRAAVVYLKEQEARRAAQLLVDETLDRTNSLGQQPLKGSLEPSLAHKPFQYRYIIIQRYKVLYRVDQKARKVGNSPLLPYGSAPWPTDGLVNPLYPLHN